MDPTAIRDQVDRILRSESFASKSQLRRLLGFLSKNMDSQTTLKPDQVIQELWPGETKTKRSADVATEMNRLRHALEYYYAGEGKTDSIAIILPNRSVTAGDGTHEKRWIAAEPREHKEEHASKDHAPSAQVHRPRGLKSVGTVAALCVGLGIAAYISIRALAMHDQPTFGRLDGSTLAIFNAQGKELWRKAFAEGLVPTTTMRRA